MNRFLRSGIEVLLHARNLRGNDGKNKPMDPDRIKDLRKNLNLTQKEFADNYGFDIDSLKSWELGRRHPDQVNSVLLEVIEIEPEAMRSLVAKVDNRKTPVETVRSLANLESVN